MMMPHPFMPDLTSKSLDDLVKGMNDIHMKMRTIRNPAVIGQMRMVLTGYQEEYQKRMAQDMERKPKSKKEQKDA